MTGKDSRARSVSWLMLCAGVVFIFLGVLGLWLEYEGLLPSPMTRGPGGVMIVGSGLFVYAAWALLTYRKEPSGASDEEATDKPEV